ncbi:MAG: hypothetical protein FRX49_07832 [Trebouxia sp. A1-2]|nr:MAG: hypothetical protein FRX49_07832 [Trebouxia sp. A1-2]
MPGTLRRQITMMTTNITALELRAKELIQQAYLLPHLCKKCQQPGEIELHHQDMAVVTGNFCGRLREEG